MELATDVESATGLVELPSPDKGFTAFFAEAEYERDGLTFYLSTQLRVLSSSGK